MVSLFVDGRKIEAEEGEILLTACLKNGIYIPNLCFMEGRERPYGACRLCYVEIEGEQGPVLACARKVEEGLKVTTTGAKARFLQRMSFELLLSNHRLECARCGKRMVCELQRIAKELKASLRVKRLKRLDPEGRIDTSHRLFNFDGGKCVLCGRCVWLCEEKKGLGLIGFVGRGLQRRVSTFMDRPFGEVCPECSDCVEICPTGAFSFKERREGVCS